MTKTKQNIDIVSVECINCFYRDSGNCPDCNSHYSGFKPMKQPKQNKSCNCNSEYPTFTTNNKCVNCGGDMGKPKQNTSNINMNKGGRGDVGSTISSTANVLPSNIGKGLEWEKEFFDFWDYVTNSDNWIKGRAIWKGYAYLTLGNCVKSYLESLIQSTKEEMVNEMIKKIDNLSMPVGRKELEYMIEKLQLKNKGDK